MQPISVYRQQKSRPPGKQLVAAAATFCAVVALLLLLPGEQAEAKRTAIPLPLDITPTEVERFNPAVEAISPSDHWQEAKVRSGDSLSIIFQRQGLSATDVHELLTGTELTRPLTRLRPGQELAFHIEGGKLLGLKIKKSEMTTLLYERAPDGFQVSELNREPEVRTLSLIHI